MKSQRHGHIALTVSLAIGLASCREAQAPGLPTEDAGDIQAFLGATIIDGTGAQPIENGVLLVREGRIDAVGPSDSTAIPERAQRVDVSGRTIVPGLVVTHGHVGQTKGLESGPENYTEENVLSQLALYARYGVTTVVSLGSDANPALGVRDGQHTKDLRRARLYIAGEQLSGQTAEEALAAVDAMADQGVDFIKIRVDDNLGTTEKSSPEFYAAAIQRAHERGLKAAAHLFYLEDAKGLLNADIDLLAHSVRDQEVDDELIALIKEKNACQTPTLVREMVSFVYEDVPDFFADPFFFEEVDPALLSQLKDPERQQGVRESTSAQAYKKALEVAMTNLKKLADAGATISFGTDSGPPARFQGYFEHLEMEYMAEAGLTPMQILVAATGDSARCVGLDEDFGTLEAGKWADFVVLRESPLVDIKNTRGIESVWIAGNRVPPRSAPRDARTE